MQATSEYYGLVSMLMYAYISIDDSEEEVFHTRHSPIDIKVRTP